MIAEPDELRSRPKTIVPLALGDSAGSRFATCEAGSLGNHRTADVLFGRKAPDSVVEVEITSACEGKINPCGESGTWDLSPPERENAGQGHE